MIDLKSMAVTMPEVLGHPNRSAFRGVLTTVDLPSQRSPSGAKGHLVVLTKEAAQAGLPSLLGMALDYAPSLDRHDVRRKVGVITRAEIVGRNLEVGGYLFARDFPEIVREISEAAGLEKHSCELNSMRCPDRQRLKASLQTTARQILSLAAGLYGATKVKHESGECRSWTIRAAAHLPAGTAALGLSYEVTGVEIQDRRASVWSLAKVTFTGAAILRRDKAAYQNTWIELDS